MIGFVAAWTLVVIGGLALFLALTVALAPRDRGPEDDDTWREDW